MDTTEKLTFDEIKNALTGKTITVEWNEYDGNLSAKNGHWKTIIHQQEIQEVLPTLLDFGGVILISECKHGLYLTMDEARMLVTEKWAHPSIQTVKIIGNSK